MVLVPGLALWLAFPTRPAEMVAMAISILAVAGFLVVGTLYWRGLDRRLRQRDDASMRRALAFADRAERPMLAVTVAAIAATLVAAAVHGASGSVIAAAVLTLLAALEYVNYYHRQLQHFDNRRDFARMLTGRGFQRSHMSRELRAYRRR